MARLPRSRGRLPALAFGLVAAATFAIAAPVAADGATVGHFTNVVDQVSGPCPDDPRFAVGREVTGDLVVGVHEGTLTVGTGDALMTGELKPDGEYTIRSRDRTRYSVGRLTREGGRGLTELVLGDPDAASDVCRVRFSVTFTLDEPIFTPDSGASASAQPGGGSPGAPAGGSGMAVVALLGTFVVIGIAAGLIAWVVVGPRQAAAAVIPIAAAVGSLWLVGHATVLAVGPAVPLYGFSVALPFDIAVALVAAFAAAVAQRAIIGWRPRPGTRGG